MWVLVVSVLVGTLAGVVLAMNRHARRAAAAANRPVIKGVFWNQRVDPTDSGYVLIEMRIPNGDMPNASYQGDAAVDRIKRFCASFMAGYQAGQAGPDGGGVTH